MAEVGEGGGHLEFKLTTHNIDYIWYMPSEHGISRAGTYVLAAKFQRRNTSQVLKMMINNNNIRIRRAIVTEEPEVIMRPYGNMYCHTRLTVCFGASRHSF